MTKCIMTKAPPKVMYTAGGSVEYDSYTLFRVGEWVVIQYFQGKQMVFKEERKCRGRPTFPLTRRNSSS